MIPSELSIFHKGLHFVASRYTIKLQLDKILDLNIHHFSLYMSDKEFSFLKLTYLVNFILSMSKSYFLSIIESLANNPSPILK